MVEQAKIDEATIDRCAVELFRDTLAEFYCICDNTEEDNPLRIDVIGKLSGILDMAQKIKDALKREEKHDDE